MIEECELQNRINYALNYLENTDLDKLELGRHDINDWLYVNVQEYETKDAALCKFESHRRYIDIQYMINGVEAIEIADVERLKLDVMAGYDEESDVVFWLSELNQMKSIIKNGSYVILYPQNAHKPCIAVGKPAKVKKLVAKVMAI